jgi:hypothetical protein
VGLGTLRKSTGFAMFGGQRFSVVSDEMLLMNRVSRDFGESRQRKQPMYKIKIGFEDLNFSQIKIPHSWLEYRAIRIRRFLFCQNLRKFEVMLRLGPSMEKIFVCTVLRLSFFY